MSKWKRTLIILLCIAAVGAIGFYAVHAVNDIKAHKNVRAEALEKIKKENEGALPVIKIESKNTIEKKVAHYMVLLTDSEEAIGEDLALICDYYGIAHTLATDAFNPSERTCNGLKVYGSYELSIKQDLMTAISAGEDFYIGVGENDDKDHYSASNIEAMCLFLLDYIEAGSLEALVI